MSKGLERVGAQFNPSGNPVVSQIKRGAADLIDLIDTIPAEGAGAGEIARLKSLAQTAFEEAAMWAVKAATKG